MCFNVFQASLSLPGSPMTFRRGSRISQFSWCKPSKRQSAPPGTVDRSHDRTPLVLPCLDNLNFPYADDSKAVTPNSDDLCNHHNTHPFYPPGRRRLSSASYNSRMSYDGRPNYTLASRRSSYASHYSRNSYTADMDPYLRAREINRREPTHFQWNFPTKNNRSTHPLLPEVIVDKTKAEEHVSICLLRLIHQNGNNNHKLNDCRNDQ